MKTRAGKVLCLCRLIASLTLTAAVGAPLVAEAAKAGVPVAEAPPLSDPPPPASDTSSDARYDTEWVIREFREHERHQEFDLSLGVWPDFFSVSLWYGIPIVPDGFIHEINDSFMIEFGAVAALVRARDFGGVAYNAWAIAPAIGGRWNFHLTHTWTTFATLKLAARFGLGNDYNPGWFDMNAAFGALARLRDGVYARIDIGYPAGFTFGLTFPFG